MDLPSNSMDTQISVGPQLSGNIKENAMLLDVQYVRPNRKEGKPDYLYLIWKDLLTGQKYTSAIPEPKMEIYFEKPEFRNFNYNKNYEVMDKLDKVVTKYTNIIPTIANDMGDAGKNYLSRIYETKDFKRLNDFMLYPYSFGADYGIREFYRIMWLRTLDNDKVKPLSKVFMDIEADSIDIEGFTDAKTCPVDLVTVIDKDTMESYTFALVGRECIPKDTSFMSPEDKKKEFRRRELYDSRHLQEQALMNDITGLKKELNQMFKEHYGGVNYNFYFYKDERKMLAHIFSLIRQINRDFLMIWNISFDIPYLMERMAVLGMNPLDIIPNQDIPSKECYFKKDMKHFQAKNKSDFFRCTSETMYTDQMINYAAIRKSDKELRSTKLTDIARDEIKDEKLNYEEEGDIKHLPYLNYRKYVIYNIKDVLLQLGIETRTSDIETVYVTAYKNATPYENIFKQTMKLRNVQYLSYLDQGLIPGNNVNTVRAFMENKVYDENADDQEDEDNDDPKFEGALVGNPILNDNFGVELYGKPSNCIFDYSIDMDMSSFYPYTIYTHNIDPSCLYFKTFVPAEQFKIRGGTLEYHGVTDKQLVAKNKDSFTGDIAKEVFENFYSRNWISTGHKWNNLPSVNDVYEECKKKLG